LRLGGDDCEGLAELIHRMSRLIEEGDPLKAQVSIAHKKHGGWDDEVLDRMQKILHIMVPFGTLGEVTSARIGTSKDFNKKNPLIIDSEEDVNGVEFGFHMWWELMSLRDCEEYINRNSKSGDWHLFPEEGELPKWQSQIPHMVGEGTGLMFPLMKPLVEYYQEGKQTISKKMETLISNAKLLHLVKLKSMETMKDSISFQVAQVERQPELTSYKADARLSGFYRRSSSAYTDKFKRHGFNMSEFVWNQRSPRIPESSSHESVLERDGDEWQWGVNLRDKLYKKKEISLIPLPAISEEEDLLYKSLARHLSPLTSPVLDISFEKQLRLKKEPFLKEFQEKLDNLINSKSENLQFENSLFATQNLIYRGNLFFAAKLRDGTLLSDQILKDLQNNKSIIQAHVIFEPITNSIYNVRISTKIRVDKSSLSSSKEISTNANIMNRHPISKLLITGHLKTNKTLIHMNLISNDNNSHKTPISFDCVRKANAFECGINDIPLNTNGIISKKELKAYKHGQHLSKKFTISN